MPNESTDALISTLQNELKKQPISKAWLFGSYACGEERFESDVDLLVRYDKEARISLFTIVEISLALSDAIHKDVDLIEDGRLLPFARESAERDKILIYEREA